jgi:hypothetical protein
MPYRDPKDNREACRRWYRANSDKKLQYTRTRNFSKRVHDFTEADYEALLAKQGGGCAICGAKEPGGPTPHGRFHIDHDHETGKLRGLLCSEHNLGLGKFDHDPELLLKAIDYLAKPPAQMK